MQSLRQWLPWHRGQGEGGGTLLEAGGREGEVEGPAPRGTEDEETGFEDEEGEPLDADEEEDDLMSARARETRRLVVRM